MDFLTSNPCKRLQGGQLSIFWDSERWLSCWIRQNGTYVMTTSRSRHIFFQNKFLVSSHIQHSPGINHFWIFKDQPVIHHPLRYSKSCWFSQGEGPQLCLLAYKPLEFCKSIVRSTLSKTGENSSISRLAAIPCNRRPGDAPNHPSYGWDPPGILIKNPK